MNRIVFFGVLLFILTSCSKQLNCENFKTGNFIVPTDTEGVEPYRIIRKGEEQIEIDNEGIKRYSKIKWLNDCNYLISFDETKMDLNDFQKRVNEVGGILVKVKEVKGKCLYYTSNIKGDSKSQSIDGVLCKE